MGSGVGKENVKVNFETKTPEKPKIPGKMETPSPAKKKKKIEKSEGDVLEKLVSTTTSFMERCTKMEEERNALFREMLGIYAAANNVQKN